MRKTLLSVLLATAFTSTVAQAQIVNGSFQSGDLTGWTVGPTSPCLPAFPTPVSVETTPTPPAPPPDLGDNFFARLAAGCGGSVYTTLSQIVTLAAGDTLSGYAFFRSNDYLPYDDDGYVTIDGITKFEESVASTNGGDSGWKSFNFTAPSTGSYTIEAGVRNCGFEDSVPGTGPTVAAVDCGSDNLFASELFLDGFTIREGDGSVPEPGTIALFATGIVAFGLARRRKAA